MQTNPMSPQGGGPSEDSDRLDGNRWRHSRHEAIDSCIYGKCKKTSACGCVPSYRMRTKFDCALCSLVVIAVVSMFLAVFVPVVVNNLVDDMVNEQLVIDSTDAPNYKSWQSNTDPDSNVVITYKLHFFDLQNPAETLQGEVPYVAELGPYAFREYYYNFDITWTDDGDTVELNNQRFYVFDPDNTVPGLSLDDQITLSYPTVLGFEWLIDSIPVNASILLEYVLEEKLFFVYDEILKELHGLEKNISDSRLPGDIVKSRLLNETEDLIYQVEHFYNGLDAFIAESNPADLTVKSILCSLKGETTHNIGVSPFWSTDPVSAYFGWLEDPVLFEVLGIIKKIEADTNTTIPWSVAVPGVATNYSSTAEAKRRKGPSKFKTGKKNIREVNKYVTYVNETSMWICVAPMDSQNYSTYIPGEMFPACEISQYDWNATTYAEKGYRLPFATPYANRIKGSDGNLVAKPVTTDTLQLFIGDIYRSAYTERVGSVNDWHDVTLLRYKIQLADLQNVSLNPDNEQYYSFGPSGMLNLTLAASVPTFATFPHFLYGSTDLVASVRGLSPNKEIHDTFLDYEPQTGLLTRAAKRLQLAYYHNDTTFPDMPAEFGTEADGICTNFTDLITELNKIGITDYTPTCDASKPRNLLTCLSENQDWTFNNGGVYMPYAWVEESTVGTEDDANALKDTLYFIEDLANDIEWWGLFAAGISVSFIVTMLFTRDFLLFDHTKEDYSDDFEPEKKQSLLGANSYNPQFDNSDLR